MLTLEEIMYYKEQAARVLQTQESNILLVEHSHDCKCFRRILRVDPCVMNSAGLNKSDEVCTIQGLTLFETRDKQHIPFLKLRLIHDQNSGIYTLCKKGDLFKIERRYREYSKVLNTTSIPIIEESKLNEIMNLTVKFAKKRKVLSKYGVTTTRGLLFQGKPGNGKSLVCNYIEARMGISACRYTSDGLLNDLNSIKRFNKTLTILDDIDIGFLNRRQNSRLCCSLLSKLDNGQPQGTIAIRILTTNEDVTDIIDAAFFRPGRIDKTFYFDNPTRSQRKEFIARWKIDIGEHINYVLDHTEEFSFAELQGLYGNLVVQHQIEQKPHLDIDLAIQQIIDNRDKIKNSSRVGFREETP
jgi:thioredoxin-related protein